MGPRKDIFVVSPDSHAKEQVLGERTCPSYLRSVCSNRLSCGLSNFDSSQYSIYMQVIKRYGITM